MYNENQLSGRAEVCEHDFRERAKKRGGEQRNEAVRFAACLPNKTDGVTPVQPGGRPRFAACLDCEALQPDGGALMFPLSFCREDVHITHTAKKNNENRDK